MLQRLRLCWNFENNLFFIIESHLHMFDLSVVCRLRRSESMTFRWIFPQQLSKMLTFYAEPDTKRLSEISPFFKQKDRFLVFLKHYRSVNCSTFGSSKK